MFRGKKISGLRFLSSALSFFLTRFLRGHLTEDPSASAGQSDLFLVLYTFMLIHRSIYGINAQTKWAKTNTRKQVLTFDYAASLSNSIPSLEEDNTDECA